MVKKKKQLYEILTCSDHLCWPSFLAEFLAVLNSHWCDFTHVCVPPSGRITVSTPKWGVHRP